MPHRDSENKIAANLKLLASLEMENGGVLLELIYQQERSSGQCHTSWFNLYIISLIVHFV